jgi:hypothetical protein
MGPETGPEMGLETGPKTETATGLEQEMGLYPSNK